MGCPVGDFWPEQAQGRAREELVLMRGVAGADRRWAGSDERRDAAVTGVWHSGGVFVSRVGFTSLKGARHLSRRFVDLTLDGPVGDRVFCLIDPVRGRVLRTVENPTLVQTRASWDAGVLTVMLPGATVEGVPAATGPARHFDYWARRVAVEIVDGPWAAAYSRPRVRRGARPVPRAPSSTAPVSAWSPPARSTSSHAGSALACSTRKCARRSPCTPTHRTKDAWLGGRLTLGEAEVEVRSAIPRCHVIDLDPDTGIGRPRPRRRSRTIVAGTTRSCSVSTPS